MGCGDEVVVFDLEVANGAGRHVKSQRLPVVAVIEGDVYLGFSACVEQAFAFGVFADGAGRCAVGNAVVDLLPGLAAIVGAEEVRAHVVEAQGVDCGVGGLGVEVTGVHVEDLPEGLQLRWGHVVPVPPAVGCGPDEAVVGARPEAIDVERREAKGIDTPRRVGLAVGSVFIGPDDRRYIPGLATEVGADFVPVLATVLGEPQGVGGEVEFVRIDGRELQRLSAKDTVAAERLGFDVSESGPCGGRTS